MDETARKMKLIGGEKECRTIKNSGHSSQRVGQNSNAPIFALVNYGVNCFSKIFGDCGTATPKHPPLRTVPPY